MDYLEIFVGIILVVGIFLAIGKYDYNKGKNIR